jgi:hypothetical protein
MVSPLNFVNKRLPAAPQSCNLALPARLAWLSCAVAVIFVREPPGLFAATAAVAIATPITASITIKTSTASRSAWPAGCGLGASFVHLQVAATHFFSIEPGDCLRGLGIVGHFNKRKSPGTSRLPVHRNVNTRDLTEGLEQGAQVRFRGLKTHVTDEQILHILLSFNL